MDYSAQKIASMFRISWALSLLLLAMACGEKKNSAPAVTAAPETTEALPYFNTPDFSPLFLSGEAEVNEKITHRIGNFSLLDQDGNTITQDFVDGRIHVADFFFTSCGSICPKMTTHMKRLSDSMGNDPAVALLSYSVTPWIDSVPVLHRYAEARGIRADNWRLLTGSKTAIYELARKSYFAEQELGFTKDSTEFLHTEHFILVDKHRRIRGIYNGTLPIEIEQLYKDIVRLKEEQ